MTTENTVDTMPMPTPAAGIPRTRFEAIERQEPTLSTLPATPVATPPTSSSGKDTVPAPSTPAAAPQGLVARLHGAYDVLAREIVKFGAIGALGYVVDFYVFNLLRVGIWPIHDAPLANKTVMCKVISVTIATVVTWLGNRYWTFRHRRRATAKAEFALFMVMNIGGLLIAAACLGVSHYVFDLTSPLADNISANVVGLILGTLFRFWAYRTFVFTDLQDELAQP